MNNMIWLVRREIWENRSLWIAPLVLAGVILVTAAFGGIHIGEHGGWWVGTSDQHDLRSVKAEIYDKRQMIYALTLSTFTMVELSVMSIVLFFYLLDSLLAERKDRSILFWKSLPVSDTQVVLSKLLTAIIVVPIFVLILSSVLQLLFALVWTLRFNGTVLGDMLLAWDGVTWLSVQATFLLFFAAGVLWYLPLLAYLMLVSVWARRNAFLWAILPPLSILLIEGLISQSHHFADFLGRRLIGLFELMDFPSDNGPEKLERLPTVSEMFGHISHAFTSYETWLGVLVAAAMIVVTIRIRRLRDDS